MDLNIISYQFIFVFIYFLNYAKRSSGLKGTIVYCMLVQYSECQYFDSSHSLCRLNNQ